MKYLSSKIKPNSFGFILAGIASLAALFIFWGYQYGTENHAIVVPFLKKFISPNLYPNDYLIAQKPFFFNYFWDFLGMIVKCTGIPINIIFFSGYLILLFLFFFIFYLITQKIFADRSVSILALLILLVSPFNPLGGTETFGASMANQTASIPLCLIAIYNFLSKRYCLPFVIVGIAFYIHPLSAFYTFICLCAGLYAQRDAGKKVFLLTPFLFVLITCPLWLKRITNAPASLNFFYADPLWLKLLHMRSGGHIDILMMGWGTLIKFVLMILLFMWSLKYKSQGETHRMVMIFIKTIFSLCFAAFFFTEVIPFAFIIQMQFFRSCQFFFYFALIYLANALIRDYSVSGLRQRLVILTVALALCAAAIRPHYFAIDNAQNRNWIGAQLWARNNTQTDSIFITPPDMAGFRIESERTTYAEYKDGTQMFFNPKFGEEWFDRMQKLGFKNYNTMRIDYQKLTENDLENIAAQTGDTKRPVFAVKHSDVKILQFPVVYRNDEFIIYRVGLKTGA
jgi:4-amino-4-deoxy-L-arabinose transferase-like glycosyltransferase